MNWTTEQILALAPDASSAKAGQGLATARKWLTLGADGLTFVVTHVRADGSTAYRDQATAKFASGKLVVAGTSGAPGGGTFQRTMYKD